MKLIDYAVATALAASAVTVANAASAIPNSYDINNYSGSVVNARISGSTAVDNSITNTLAAVGDGLCATATNGPAGNATISTLSVYYVNGNSAAPLTSTTSAFTNRVMTCLANPATTHLPTGTLIAVFKESTVGSANGVQPLISAASGAATTLNFINASTMQSDGNEGNCTANDLHAVALLNGTTTSVYSYNEYFNCPADSVPTTGTDIPTGGVADVEAQMLLTPAGGPISASQASTLLNSAAGYDTVWGVPVTTNLYQALQAAEGLCNDVNNAACTPSLSKETVASIYSGAVPDWNFYGLSNASGATTAYICRRDIGSGTEASFEAYFLGARCSKSSLSMAPEGANSASSVFANPSTGRVLSCMQAVSQGGSVTGFYHSFTATFTGGDWAVGVTSTEIKQSQITVAGKPDVLRFVAVDGVLPTLANVINGNYPYFSTDAIYSVKSGPNAPTGAALTLFKDVTGLFGLQAFMKLNDSAFALNQGINGGDLSPAGLYASTATFNLPVNTASAVSAPINVWDKASSGSVDNCDTPVLSTSFPGLAAPESKLLGTGNVNN